MMTSAQDREVDQNYDAFQRALGSLLPRHRGQYALMRLREFVGFFDNPGDAFRAGIERFEDELFSIQEVTDEPIDLGLWSHVQH
jgi:hypothetical protein